MDYMLQLLVTTKFKIICLRYWEENGLKEKERNYRGMQIFILCLYKQYWLVSSVKLGALNFHLVSLDCQEDKDG